MYSNLVQHEHLLDNAILILRNANGWLVHLTNKKCANLFTLKIHCMCFSLPWNPPIDVTLLANIWFCYILDTWLFYFWIPLSLYKTVMESANCRVILSYIVIYRWRVLLNIMVTVETAVKILLILITRKLKGVRCKGKKYVYTLSFNINEWLNECVALASLLTKQLSNIHRKHCITCTFFYQIFQR